MWINEYQDDEFNIRDSVCGVVTGGCRSGLFVRLEDGQEAFASFGGLYPGTKVICTVLKKATEKWRVLVAIDSVLTEAVVA
ncbi:MAG: hypothetical protein ACI4ET_06610 [Bilifractor sp.]